MAYVTGGRSALHDPAATLQVAERLVLVASDCTRTNRRWALVDASIYSRTACPRMWNARVYRRSSLVVAVQGRIKLRRAPPTNLVVVLVGIWSSMSLIRRPRRECRPALSSGDVTVSAVLADGVGGSLRPSLIGGSGAAVSGRRAGDGHCCFIRLWPGGGSSGPP